MKNNEKIYKVKIKDSVKLNDVEYMGGTNFYFLQYLVTKGEFEVKKYYADGKEVKDWYVNKKDSSMGYHRNWLDFIDDTLFQFD